ncbi:MAG: DUF3426 domain-containing protein [Pseudomonadales bacterium]
MLETRSTGVVAVPDTAPAAAVASPVAFEQRAVALPPPRTKLRRLAWVLPPALFLVLGLLAWLQFSSLAQMPVLRPAFERLCPVLGCSLPPPRALNRVTAHDLTLGPVPDRPGRLEVRLLLVNGAEFEQAFPELRLRFTNKAGERIVDHTFSPPDYLAPEDRLFQALPSRLPVQVLLDIPDPGPAGVNYDLELH